jgi:protein-disulfide isomerase
MPAPLRLWLTALLLACAAIASRPAPAAAAAFTPEQKKAIEAIIHDYLVNNPGTLIEALQKAEDKLNSEAHDKAAAALRQRHHDIYDDPATPVGGNPHGDVAIVEFFDYRCPYCKEVEPSLEKLLHEDRDLRFVYKELPVLGPASVTAAHAALAARKQGKYAAFHDAMMAARGRITDETVFHVAASVGLDVERLKRDMAAPEIAQDIESNLALADALGIHGTPGFVIGDHIVPGAADLDSLRKLVAAARKAKG